MQIKKEYSTECKEKVTENTEVQRWIHEVYCAPARDRGFTSEPKYLDTPDSHILDVGVCPIRKSKSAQRCYKEKLKESKNRMQISIQK